MIKSVFHENRRCSHRLKDSRDYFNKNRIFGHNVGSSCCNFASLKVKKPEISAQLIREEFWHTMAVVLIISLCGMVASAELFNQIDNDTTSLMLEDFESVSNYRTHVKRENRNDYESPRPDQRSLLIVFDATGSMHDDLEQLRAGAQEIINEFSVRADNPIYNYVLVVYRDPSKWFHESLITH